MIDTAGIRKTDNIVEQIGVQKSEKIIEEADLIIAIFDGSKEITEEDYEILDKINSKKVLVIINKQDLNTNIYLSKFEKYNIIKCSVKNNQNIEKIYEEINKMFNLNELETNDLTYISNARQISLVKKSLEIIKEIKKQNENQTPVDLIQIDLQNLWETLGEIIGDSYKEELLDELFSKFCLGK